MRSYITKICLAFGLLQFSTCMIAQTPCDGNMSGNFPCEGFDLQARLTNNAMDANFANDSWGWTDPEDGKEYALVGLSNGTAFIDISNPTSVDIPW